MATVIEVFADVVCPFTHVGLRRFVERRRELGRDDVRLRVRAWPLELVNGTPLTGDFVGEEIDELREQAVPDLFVGFDRTVFPTSSLGALALSAAATEVSAEVGEAVALEVRDRLFERGLDVESPDVLAEIARRHGVPFTGGEEDRRRVIDDWDAGRARGVIGSPHFFTPSRDWFCPSLDISRDDHGHLRIAVDPGGFDEFLADCFAPPA